MGFLSGLVDVATGVLGVVSNPLSLIMPGMGSGGLANMRANQELEEQTDKLNGQVADLQQWMTDFMNGGGMTYPQGPQAPQQPQQGETSRPLYMEVAMPPNASSVDRLRV